MRYAMGQMTQDLLRLMDALDVEQAHFVGHSTGGAIGQIIAVEYPQRLKKLVLSSTWTHADAFFTRLFEARHALLRHSGPMGYLRAASAMLYPPWWLAQNETLAAEQERQQAASFPPVDVVLSRIEAIMRFDRRRDLGRIRTPTLVTVATDDMVTPMYFSQALAKAIPGAKLKVFERGGHMPYHVVDQEYNRTVLDFLSS